MVGAGGGEEGDEDEEGAEVGEKDEEAGPSPPFAKDATGFGMTMVGGACVGMGEGVCCGVGIGCAAGRGA